MSEFHIALVGHRPQNLFGYNLYRREHKIMFFRLVQIIQEYLNEYDTVWVHSSMALGVDTIWACAARTAMQRFPGRVKFHAEIPVKNQPDVWRSKSDIQRWNELVEMADKKSIYANTYKPGIIYECHNSMIKHSDLLIAIWDGSEGRTAEAVYHAEILEKQIRIIDPSEFVPKD